MTKTRYIIIAIVAIIGLLLTSAPVIPCQLCKFLVMEPNGKAGCAVGLVHGDSFGGYISSDVSIRVRIYNETNVFYDGEGVEHDFGGHEFLNAKPCFSDLKGGDLYIIVTNTLPERIRIMYYLWAGDYGMTHDIILLPVQ